jgi:hypothetical protein
MDGCDEMLLLRSCLVGSCEERHTYLKVGQLMDDEDTRVKCLLVSTIGKLS